MAILGPKPEGQEHDMRVRRPSGGCDLHQRTEVNFLERRLNEAARTADATRACWSRLSLRPFAFTMRKE